MEEAAKIFGIAHYLCACLLFFLICIRLFQNTWMAAGALIVLTANYSFTSYATGGLETMQQAFLMLGLLYCYLLLIEKPESRGAAFAFSVTSGLLMLCRLDSAVLILCVGIGALWVLRRSGVISYAVLLIPGTAILGAFLSFCYYFYGNIFPNTFYVKAEGVTIANVVYGINYVMGFLKFYLIAPFLAVGLVLAFRKGKRPFFVPIAIYSVLWMSYVICVGGDFMEFRMMVPALPVFLLLIANAFTYLKPNHQMTFPAICVPVLVLASCIYYIVEWHLVGVERIEALQEHLTSPSQDWIGVGERLHQVFPGGYRDGPKIAVTAAGAIPFHSALRTVDMLGLNDVEIARNGIQFADRPGHRRMVDPHLLVERNVHLVLGHPYLIPEARIEDVQICAGRFLSLLYSGRQAPETFLQYPVLATKVNEEFVVAMLYLSEHPAVEVALGNGSVTRIRPRSDDGCNA